MKRSTKWLIGIIVVVVIVIAGFFSFGGSLGGKKAAQTVTVGRVAPSKGDEAIWKVIKKTAKDKYNVNIEFKDFTDYVQPNKALQNGEIDLNAFQTQQYLNVWNKTYPKSTIVSIGNTIVTPLRLYSQKVKSVKDLKNGATIVIDNDAANQARSLELLQTAGLIKLNNKVATPTPTDITSNPKHFKITPIDSNQTARQLSSVDAAIVNGGFALAAKVPSKYTIFTEPLNKTNAQYFNIIAATKKNKNKQAYKDVVKAYQTKAVKKAITKAYGEIERSAWDVKF
ncbi:abc-type metal ion transport system, periplasmic component surface antigen [Secundilactobacillus odoratitofui DSM 19909 = JCM 15043]|uniref:Lipoprotein n=1 Tax=Secundilactobacillus odoratitofui DSM 19909 = JCM 15043 TaxID=1423776 RepID=A0A0R1LYS2_9LACO|nr:MetQ/NlpA family ABC transporter substrate-binding protein [Secundilactobacillus odoratitofui]KRK98787.1 abc-type metal ion transport system, periplasmic component surface antigen [Secundilactobacillus odoratitofui DSM 19909 = JCM 15043]